MVPAAAPGTTRWRRNSEGWDEARFRAAGFRAVPGCIVRHSAYVAPGVVLMPCFLNVGAFVDEGSMIDTWATVGSCAQIGKRCHISGGTGIGGVLEPLQAGPVIIEDDCFIGARAEVAEGVRVGRGSVLSMGVFIGASTRIVDRESGEVHYGAVPPYHPKDLQYRDFPKCSQSENLPSSQSTKHTAFRNGGTIFVPITGCLNVVYRCCFPHP